MKENKFYVLIKVSCPKIQLQRKSVPPRNPEVALLKCMGKGDQFTLECGTTGSEWSAKPITELLEAGRHITQLMPPGSSLQS